MTARRLRAPQNDGGVLVDPPPGELNRLLETNKALLAGWDRDFQGRRASWLRAIIRGEVLAASRSFLKRHDLPESSSGTSVAGGLDVPLIVTGHQPELFHPGVWIKNFAVARLARACNGVALNLIVDNDIPKSAAIQVPSVSAGSVRLEQVEFDRWGGDIPFEDLAVQDEELFSTFESRVRQVMGPRADGTVLENFWSRAMARKSETAILGTRFSLARRELEAAWGFSNLEVPLSTVCETDGFLWFVAHFLAQLPFYQKVHNESLTAYRSAHRIRSKNHPVAALGREGDWIEAPFWVWRQGTPRRRGLLARQRGRVMDLRIAGEHEILIELPLAPDREACCAVDRLRELAGRRVRLRTRALTTTVFSRFLLGDLFVHGIGGAKYDELGDEISRRFFGIEPPGFLTCSLTLWLDLPRESSTKDDVQAIDRRLRDSRFNPERYLIEPYSDEARNVIRVKQDLIARPTTSRRERRARCLSIRRCNEALQPWVQQARNDLLALRSRVRDHVRSDRAARNREYSFLLHPADGLKEKMATAAQRVLELNDQGAWGGYSG
jgi:hypothetical protein